VFESDKYQDVAVVNVKVMALNAGIDWPVRNQAEWEKFLNILMTDTAINGEYDILLLPANGFSFSLSVCVCV
jgi:hypothetical protein